MSVGSEMIERMAQSIYDATDPLSGDPIAVLIHVSDHLFWDGVNPGRDMTDLERQLVATKEVCRAAAKAALQALMTPTEAMTQAGQKASSGWLDTGEVDRCFKAMIRSAMEGE